MTSWHMANLVNFVNICFVNDNALGIGSNKSMFNILRLQENSSRTEHHTCKNFKVKWLSFNYHLNEHLYNLKYFYNWKDDVNFFVICKILWHTLCYRRRIYIVFDAGNDTLCYGRRMHYSSWYWYWYSVLNRLQLISLSKQRLEKNFILDIKTG